MYGIGKLYFFVVGLSSCFSFLFFLFLFCCCCCFVGDQTSDLTSGLFSLRGVREERSCHFSVVGVKWGMPSKLLVLLSLLLCFCNCQESCEPPPEGVNAPKEVIIGGLSSSFIPIIPPIMRLAIDLINEDDCILPGFFSPLFFSSLFPCFHTFSPSSSQKKLS